MFQLHIYKYYLQLLGFLLLSDKESEYLLSAFYESYPGYHKMKDEVTYYQIIALMRLIDICQEGSIDGHIDYQMKKIATFSKRSISSQLIS